jgi:hypothetical protein
MINIFHLLRIVAKKHLAYKSVNHIEEHISKRFYVKNGELTALQKKSHILFTKTFPFYKSLNLETKNFSLRSISYKDGKMI